MTQLLIINPGSTSTKVALFQDETCIHEKTYHHDTDVDASYEHIIDQKENRKSFVVSFLNEIECDLKSIDVFVGRGGMLKPLKKGGTYLINKQMIHDLTQAIYGEHASNLGAILAYELATTFNKPAFIVDPVCIDEMNDIAKITGFPHIERKSIFHALNQKAIARKYAKMKHTTYENINVIVCHLGGGISVGLHQKGKVIDVNNALGGDGPFSPERVGTMPSYPLVDLCYSNQYTKHDIQKMLVGQGGLVAYLNTADGKVIESRIEQGDLKAKFYFQAMAYHVVKEIGSLYFAAQGNIDDILITGGLAYNKTFIGYIKSFLDPIKQPVIYPGEEEMQALALGALRVVRKEEKTQQY